MLLDITKLPRHQKCHWNQAYVWHQNAPQCCWHLNRLYRWSQSSWRQPSESRSSQPSRWCRGSWWSGSPWAPPSLRTTSRQRPTLQPLEQVWPRPHSGKLVVAQIFRNQVMVSCGIRVGFHSPQIEARLDVQVVYRWFSKPLLVECLSSDMIQE